jgi:hypothetical protein
MVSEIRLTAEKKATISKDFLVVTFTPASDCKPQGSPAPQTVWKLTALCSKRLPSITYFFQSLYQKLEALHPAK